MKKRGLLSLVLVGALALSLAACGKKADDKTITIGVTPKPHEEIVNAIKPLVEKQGYTLKIVEFNDYNTPNTALNDKELDANFFQHQPYLDEVMKNKGYKLATVTKVHSELMALYSKKAKSINDLKDGATIAIPNDATNGARALKLLAANNLIKVKDGELISAKDVTENPKNFKFKELDAAQLPRTLDDVDAAVINANYALDAGLNPTDNGLIAEKSDSEFAQKYANILVVRQGDENSDKIKVLKDALNSPDAKKFIEDKYKGAVIPMF
ncbi:MetQ/NlpA family ABC transporter substrate-binding protein [Clostridium sp. YIM B02551]|uniref:MetQ/NlpA family ABC transporter substrate-binding protein n=1 Tax=Clostridium sp. YIM B02551 TaxID=2910679 RepID=UPI001EEA7DB0|nr:MetQ/NlpA family ABC transporter substrate-binding protein [Clostridium sp. YIM B02551]